METDRTREALSRALLETLETMFFSEAEEVPDRPIPAPDQMVCAELQFHGTRDGVFRLLVDYNSAVELSRCLLCDQDSESDGHAAEGAVFELANIVCGSTLSQLYPDGHFSLSSPALSGRESAAPLPAAVFDLDGGTIAVELFWRN